MPTFDFTSPEGKTYSVEGPDGATPEQAFSILQQHLGQPAAPKIGTVQDIVQSTPNSALQGLGDFAKFGSMMIDPGAELGPMVGGPDVGTLVHQNAATIANAVDKGIAATGLPAPQTMGGRIVGGGVRSVTNPLSYIGPGGPLLKAGGAALSGIGSEAAGEAAQGTGYELPARIAGSVAGGAAAAKALGPKQAIATIPTQEELKAAAKGGYNAALNSGLELKPDAIKNFGTTVEQELIGQGYAPELAGKTFKVLDTIQNPPAGSTVTAANLDGLRKYLGRIAQETQPANGGMVKPTADAAAASTVLDRLKGFTEAPPPGSVVAGDADAFAKTIKEANANYAASQRAALVNDKIVKAELRSAAANSGQNVANTIRQRMVDILANPKLQRGFSADELAQMDRVVRGTVLGNATRYAGNLMGGGGGIGSAISAGLGAAAAGPAGAFAPAVGYGLRKASQASTMRNVSALEEMLRKRSPLYQSRLNALPMTNMAPNQAQILRGLLGPLTQ